MTYHANRRAPERIELAMNDAVLATMALLLLFAAWIGLCALAVVI